MAAPGSVVDIESKFAMFTAQWSPHIVAEFNGLHVKLAKGVGTFPWHTHDETDEVFLLHKGSLVIEMRDRDAMRLQAGDIFVVPAGVEHRPVAEDECQLLLIEPANTPNTGDPTTAAAEAWI